MLRNRHGCTDDIKICFNAFLDDNEVKDEMLMLRDCGCYGSVVKKNTAPPLATEATTDLANEADSTELPTYQLYYDLKPVKMLDPLLLY